MPPRFGHSFESHLKRRTPGPRWDPGVTCARLDSNQRPHAPEAWSGAGIPDILRMKSSGMRKSVCKLHRDPYAFHGSGGQLAQAQLRAQLRAIVRLKRSAGNGRPSSPDDLRAHEPMAAPASPLHAPAWRPRRLRRSDSSSLHESPRAAWAGRPRGSATAHAGPRPPRFTPSSSITSRPSWRRPPSLSPWATASPPGLSRTSGPTSAAASSRTGSPEPVVTTAAMNA